MKLLYAELLYTIETEMPNLQNSAEEFILLDYPGSYSQYTDQYKSAMKKNSVIKALFEDEFRRQYDGRMETKDEFLMMYAFDISTYDEELDTKWCPIIISVCEAILEGKTFEYWRGDNGLKYEQFILVANLLERKNWIDWGTSIRGCWFHSIPEKNSADIIHCNVKIPFSKENIRELIEWYKD